MIISEPKDSSLGTAATRGPGNKGEFRKALESLQVGFFIMVECETSKLPSVRANAFNIAKINGIKVSCRACKSGIEVHRIA